MIPSAFTGTTRVESGVLSVNGKLGGTFGGTFGRRPTAGHRHGMTDAPPPARSPRATSIGTLTVGNITFQAGSIYQVEVNVPMANPWQDRRGPAPATINGGSVQVLAGQGSYQPNTTYTILTAAGGRTGTFGGVTSNLAFLAPSLSYDPDTVYLTLTRNTVSFPSIGGTFNQRQAGAGTESLGQGNPIWNAVVQMDASTAQAAFNQLSGEVHASAKTALYEDSRLVRDGAWSRLRDSLRRQSSLHFDGPSDQSSTRPATATPASADPGTGIAAWAQGFGSWGYTSTNGNAAGLSRPTGGVLVGVDAPPFEVARIGLFGGYSHTNFNVADRQSSGGSDNVHLGAYGGAQWGPIGLRAGLAYTWHNLLDQPVGRLPGFADSLRATCGAGTFQVFGEAGYRFDVGPATFEPFANIAWMSLSTKGFSETGGARRSAARPSPLTSPPRPGPARRQRLHRSPAWTPAVPRHGGLAACLHRHHALQPPCSLPGAHRSRAAGRADHPGRGPAGAGASTSGCPIGQHLGIGYTGQFAAFPRPVRPRTSLSGSEGVLEAGSSGRVTAIGMRRYPCLCLLATHGTGLGLLQPYDIAARFS